MKLLLLDAMASLLLPDVSTAQTRSTDARRVETYQSVAIDAAGGLVITTADQKTIFVPMETEQSSFSEPIVSSARTADGAQAEFPNCCTSYDIPLRLVQEQVAHLRIAEANPTNFRLSASGFLAEIDRMQLEVREYLSLHPADPTVAR